MEKELNKIVNDYDSKIEELKEKLNNYKTYLDNEKDKKIKSEIKADIEKIEAEIAKNEEKKQSLETNFKNIEENENNINEESEGKNKLINNRDELSKEKDNLEKYIENEKNKKVLEELNSDIKKINSEIEKVNNLIYEKNQDIKNKEIKNEELKKIVETYKIDITRGKDKISQDEIEVVLGKVEEKAKKLAVEEIAKKRNEMWDEYNDELDEAFLGKKVETPEVEIKPEEKYESEKIEKPAVSADYEEVIQDINYNYIEEKAKEAYFNDEELANAMADGKAEAINKREEEQIEEARKVKTKEEPEPIKLNKVVIDKNKGTYTFEFSDNTSKEIEIRKYSKNEIKDILEATAENNEIKEKLKRKMDPMILGNLLLMENKNEIPENIIDKYIDCIDKNKEFEFKIKEVEKKSKFKALIGKIKGLFSKKDIMALPGDRTGDGPVKYTKEEEDKYKWVKDIKVDTSKIDELGKKQEDKNLSLSELQVKYGMNYNTAYYYKQNLSKKENIESNVVEAKTEEKKTEEHEIGE